MVVFERNKPKQIIFWAVVFLFTQFVGYATYLIMRIVVNKQINKLKLKIIEDEIYAQLSNSKLHNKELNLSEELFEFNKRSFNAKATNNNEYQFFNSYTDLKSDFLKKIKNANHSILIQVTKVNNNDFESIKDALIEKAKNSVIIKLVYSKGISPKLKKQFKQAGIKVYKFLNFNTRFTACKNVICIDNEFAYFANLDIDKKQMSGEYDICDCLLRVKGDIVETINLELNKDIIFASGKYLEYQSYTNNSIKNEKTIQYTVNQHNTNLELLIVKAISNAKKSIQLQLGSFIPTESMLSLLNFAINSNIAVRLMVPLRTANYCKFYATRAYAKELALLGANVYLFDGYIRFNSIVVDDEYLLYGDFSMDREFLDSSLQNVLIFKDGDAINHINKLFNSSINNSYRINNANFMLLREKFFKNFN